MICKSCKLDLPVDQFGTYLVKGRIKRSRRKSCKTCRVKEEKVRYANDPELVKRKKLAVRKSVFKNQYGITPEQYDQMFLSQNGKCRICKRVSDKRLNVDHCHNTGKIRGLLCWNCNIGIGYMKHSVEILKTAVQYLGG